MKTKQALVPELRFEGFSSPTSSTLGEVTKWSSGGTPPKDNPKYWGDDIPWISAASMRGSYYSDSKVWLTIDGLKNGSKLIKKGGILLLVRGSMLWNCIPVGVAERNLAFNQDVKGIEPSSAVNNVYLLHWFSSMEHRLLNMVVGTGIGAGKLDTKDLQSLSITHPTLPEQEKIAAFLTSVDDRIDQLKRKKSLLQDYKKGAMQKLFSQELRFKDEQGKDFPDWEEKKVKDTFEIIPTKKFQILGSKISEEGQYPVVDQGKDLVAGFSDDKDKLFDKGEVIVFGDHTTHLKFIDFKFVVGADGTKLLRNKNENLRCLYYILSFNNVEQEGYKRHFSILKEVNLKIPSLPEQTKIANFLSSLDQKIEQVDTQITQTQTFKKGLLQQMFV